MSNRIILEDCERIAKESFINWELFKNKSLLITGSTGLIGLNLVNLLMFVNRRFELNIKVYLPVRNVSAAYSMFGKDDCLSIFEYKLGDPLRIEGEIDYIVHLASPTSSRFFSENPTETLLTNIEGLKSLLEYSKSNRIKKLVFVSTMEVYGFPEKGHEVYEDEIGSFEPMVSRNSYPIAKIACESLCHAYYSQYGVPSVVIRATQTFGPGVKYDDGRVFAQFMRCAIEKKDIVLKSLGLTERSYLYTGDAVTAIIVGLQKGISGEAYTAANPSTYCSIKEMAEMVSNRIANGKIKVVFDVADDVTKLGYANTLYMKLNVDKLCSLGWKPFVDLYEMYDRMIQSVM